MAVGHAIAENTQQSIDQIAKKVVALRLETPISFFLEAHKPLNSLFYNGSLMLAPVASPFFGAERIQQLQDILADRDNIDRLLERIGTYSLARKGKTTNNM